MPDIRRIYDSTHKGKEGFVIEWELRGFSRFGAEFRAMAMTAGRFPTTITEISRVGTREFGETDFNVGVFVPTEGFVSAGVGQPLKWLRNQFEDRILDIGS